MKQPHTEPTIDHTDDQQNTGNHRKSGAGGADRLGGTRAGADNVEGDAAGSDKADSVERGTDIDRVASLDGSSPGTKTVTSHERAPERDEHGRL